jgi:hypothetical protein
LSSGAFLDFGGVIPAIYPKSVRSEREAIDLK